MLACEGNVCECRMKNSESQNFQLMKNRENVMYCVFNCESAGAHNNSPRNHYTTTTSIERFTVCEEEEEEEESAQLIKIAFFFFFFCSVATSLSNCLSPCFFSGELLVSLLVGMVSRMYTNLSLDASLNCG